MSAKSPVFASAYQPGKKINAHPASKIYQPGTGSGTGRPALAIGTQTRNGQMRPLSPMGSPTGSLTSPPPTMQFSASAQRARNVAEAKANGTFGPLQEKFNRLNPSQHMDDAGNIGAHPYADSRPPSANTATPSASSSSSSSAPPPSTTFSTAGQAESMRNAMAPNPGEDRWGRTAASPSARGAPAPSSAPATPPSSAARGDWQSSTWGNGPSRSMSSDYGRGAANIEDRNTTASNVGAASAAGGMMGSAAGPFSSMASSVASSAAAKTSSMPKAPVLPPRSNNGGTPSTPSGNPRETPGTQAYANARDQGFQERMKQYETASAQQKVAGPEGTIKASTAQFGSNPAAQQLPEIQRPTFASIWPTNNTPSKGGDQGGGDTSPQEDPDKKKKDEGEEDAAPAENEAQ